MAIQTILSTEYWDTSLVKINDNFVDLDTDLALKANISSPTFTGTVTLPNGQTLIAPVLGTPTSGTLTNCTFPTLNQSTTGTSGGLTGTPSITVATVTTTGNIELGNASDTTISRVSAGVISVESVTVPTISSTNTITNKRNTKRVVVNTQAAAPAINTDNGDIFQITGLAQAITSFTTNLTGTPVAGDMMMIQITDNGTARALTFGASFASTTVALPTTTVISTMLRVLFQRNNANTVWDCISVS